MLTKNQNKIIGGIMKKLVIAVLISAMLLSFAACGKTSNNQSVAGGETTTTTLEPANDDVYKYGEAIILNDCDVAIDDAYLVKNSKAESGYAIVFSLSITNRSGKSARPRFLFSEKAFQNGIEIDKDYSYNTGGDNFHKEIRNDITIKECKFCYPLQNMNEVEYELDDIISVVEDPVVIVFHPEDLEIIEE